ncbi:flagellar motor switch protein FliG [Acidihalobacter yilgarnensis]|uniref:Flagellar motor switch protein FliG n=1 Tax=Acidihalobacter yilgarnensis TaxID=2819280 RepID=A0A1D8IPT8_9GAMM|nr:flagellar motor switch protein FliG [Acidihalobacter yilgarnensis]AOU98471.1 flagellar motor switch protein FliG [Acidihalobacter yilgarnensis]
MSSTAPVNGAQRAAILLMTLGEQEAAEILKHMGPREVQKIGTAMAELNGISRSAVSDVLSRFIDIVGDQTALGIGNDDYIRNVLVTALGEDKAGGIMDRILTGHNSRGLDQLKWMDARAIAEVVRLEHPQIIAIVLSHLDADQAADVLVHLQDRVRADVIMRIATLDVVQPSAIKELDEVLERQFSGNSSVKSSAVGGLKSAANILNFMDSSVESAIIEIVAENDSDIAQKIEELMFVFDNLAELDDRSIQGLLREVASETLVVALKGADEPLREKIFKNISKRAAEMLRDDLEAKGPVRLSEVEAAQKEILAVARRMADSGEIALGGKGGDEYV